jgi:hypothetical protein
MSLLVKELVKGLLYEKDYKKTVGIYAGGFKPPTKGHFEVLETALKQNPDIEEMLVYIGKKDRGTISQKESKQIWDIYGKYLPLKVKYIESTVPPIKAVYNYAKENPEEEVLWVLGAREESEDDFSDISKRTKSITKYPNLELRTIITKGGISGTAARNALKTTKEKFETFLPDVLSDEDKDEIWVTLTNPITEGEVKDSKNLFYKSYIENLLPSHMKVNLEENKITISNLIKEEATYSNHIDYKQHIKDLTQDMVRQGMGIEPLPKVRFIHSDSPNAQDFFGKTAYYDPHNMEIVLYTEGRHPKDIVRSFAHEMIHHKQNLEGRLGNINTTNTNEDDELEDIEKEAYLNGNITFRNWTDSLKENNSNQITEETLFEEEDRLMAEVVNPDGERFEYEESNIKSLYTYKDSRGNLYFVRVFFNPLSTNPHFEFKTGWFKDNDISKPIYDPHLPPNTTGMDNLKRRNTVAKIYRDEILPFFIKNKDLSNKLYIKPISHSRHIFSKRLVKNHTPKNFNIEEDGEIIIILLPINEKKTKDPFGINVYAMELGRLREDEDMKVSPFSKNMEEYILSDIKEYGDILEFKIDLEDIYQYSSDSNLWEFYDDVNSVKIIVKLKSINKNIQEFKFYSLQDGKQLSFGKLKHYNPKVMNTIFKIFMDEVLPNNSKILIQPFDYLRYRLFRAMLNNNLDGNEYEIDIKDDPIGQSRILIQNKKDNIKEVMGKVEYQIYCDMDGVLADFERGYEELTGIDLKGEFKPDGEEFWDPIKQAGVKFWVGLKWMPGGQQLWDYIKPHNPKLLSAPSREESSRIGKYVWVKRKLPGTKLLLRSAFRKKEFANPNSILIDDRIKNIESWEQAGGIGIHHTSTENTIKELKKLGL